MGGRRALLFINPRSRHGQSDLEAALSRLRSAGIDLLPRAFSSPEETYQTIRARRADIDCVILGGGDGTMRHGARGLVETGLPLGILPLGTANDLARTLGIPRDLDGACEVIAAGRTRQIDIARAGEKYFFNAAHIGLGARVARLVSPQLKQRWGVLSYGRACVEVFRRRRPFCARLRTAGTDENLRAIHLMVANGRHFGGGMTVAPAAAIDDHLLTVVGIAPGSFSQLLHLGWRLYRGFREGDPGVWLRWTPRINVETEPPLPISADGELLASTPAEFSVVREAISVYCR